MLDIIFGLLIQQRCKRLLSRCRLRGEKRTLFVKSTSLGQPKSDLSCFSGSINGPVTQKIYAFI